MALVPLERRLDMSATTFSMLWTLVVQQVFGGIYRERSLMGALPDLLKIGAIKIFDERAAFLAYHPSIASEVALGRVKL